MNVHKQLPCSLTRFLMENSIQGMEDPEGGYHEKWDSEHEQVGLYLIVIGEGSFL
jgi:hypothetical protein